MKGKRWKSTKSLAQATRNENPRSELTEEAFQDYRPHTSCGEMTIYSLSRQVSFCKNGKISEVNMQIDISIRILCDFLIKSTYNKSQLYLCYKVTFPFIKAIIVTFFESDLLGVKTKALSF